MLMISADNLQHLYPDQKLSVEAYKKVLKGEIIPFEIEVERQIQKEEEEKKKSILTWGPKGEFTEAHLDSEKGVIQKAGWLLATTGTKPMRL